MNGNYSDYDNGLFASINNYDNPNGSDHDFYRKLADDNNSKSIVDLGCGTGIFTTTLVSQERNIVGIDSAHAMLEIAKNRLNGRKVTWKEWHQENEVRNTSAKRIVIFIAMKN